MWYLECSELPAVDFPCLQAARLRSHTHSTYQTAYVVPNRSTKQEIQTVTDVVTSKHRTSVQEDPSPSPAFETINSMAVLCCLVICYTESIKLHSDKPRQQHGIATSLHNISFATHPRGYNEAPWALYSGARNIHWPSDLPCWHKSPHSACQPRRLATVADHSRLNFHATVETPQSCC